MAYAVSTGSNFAADIQLADRVNAGPHALGLRRPPAATPRDSPVSGCTHLPRCWRLHYNSVPHDGTWRSPVAHCNGVAGVAGSNPAVPMGQSRPQPVGFVAPGH